MSVDATHHRLFTLPYRDGPVRSASGLSRWLLADGVRNDGQPMVRRLDTAPGVEPAEFTVVDSINDRMW